MLGIVPSPHEHAFDWSWRPTWVRGFADPIPEWCRLHRVEPAPRHSGHAHEPALSPLLRGFPAIQGTVAVAVALGLAAWRRKS